MCGPLQGGACLRGQGHHHLSSRHGLPEGERLRVDVFDILRPRLDIRNADAVDQDIGRENFVGGAEVGLSRERDIFVGIPAGLEARGRAALGEAREDRRCGAAAAGGLAGGVSSFIKG